LVPRADEHQGEYVSGRAERLAWVSGFGGSAGLAIVLADRAAIFVDGRYTIQVREQVDGALFEYRHLINEPPEEWLAGAIGPGARIGFDPWLLTDDMAKRFRDRLAKVGGELVAEADSPLDKVWVGQPVAPIAPIRPHDLRFAGKASGEKRAEIAAGLRASGLKSAVISAPDSLCWLLNVRGADVPCTPFALGFATIDDAGKVDLFVDPRKVLAETRAHLGNEVRVRPPSEFPEALVELGSAKATVLVDAATAGAAIGEKLRQSGAKITLGQDPCALPKARKNSVEVDGARAAHRRDGVSLAKFLRWLSLEAPKGGLTEISAAEKLADFRRGNEFFRDFSFNSISASGPNGAICHYRVDEKSNRPIERGTLYLIDSGAQYLDGTTDVTRTIAVGAPSAEMKDRFTRVLKGHIALATTRFPKGTNGQQLDAIARRPLWEAGLDYDHGTGHGVGSYLSVHEGPHRISKAPNRTPLEIGMIVSNEPGFYLDGKWGIRIENLVTVVPAKDQADFLAFETLTLAPIDLDLVDRALLSPEEVAWLNAYHARVLATLAPSLDPETTDWLRAATRQI
jgi:Xaa-Pro aminopeptidase